MVVCGIDVGVLTTKAVILDGTEVVGKSLLRSTDEDIEGKARAVVNMALSQANIGWSSVSAFVATGAGRSSITFAEQKGIPSCLARGIHVLSPDVRTLIDIGGESSVAMRVTPKGTPLDIVRQERCASGTGVFLDTMARIFRVPVEDMAKASLDGQERAEISSMCAVFAEQEVISHIHRQPPTPRDDIIKGIHGSMAVRAGGLVKRIGAVSKVAFTGGVARNVGFARELEVELKTSLAIPEEPQMVGALGAAYLAAAQ